MEKKYSYNHNYVIVFTALLLIFSTTVPGFSALPPIENNESPFRKIYEKVAPSVVMIEVESESSVNQDIPNRFFGPFFNIPIPQEQPQRQQQGIGSGIIINREGYILTNNHVIQNANKITVQIDQNEEYRGEVIGRDSLTDLAVIKLQLDGKLLPPERVAELGDSDTLEPGDYAIAIGNPVGLERTITVGVISALGRHGLTVMGAERLDFQDFIQTDAQINPGNSGGALVDINGKVIGINNMYTAQYAAIGFAIPINLAKNVADKLIAFGEVKRGFVGISGGVENITKDIQEAMGLPSTEGVLIQEVITGSPAEKAGLKNGDVIITLNGDKVKDFNDFLLKIGNHPPGDTVKMEVISDKKKKPITLTLADRDDYQNVASVGTSDSWRGINVADLNSGIVKGFDHTGIERGVIVVRIDSGSPASETNLLEGDVIIEIENSPINNVQDFEKLINEYRNSDKTILIYRLRKTSEGRITKGYVAVKSK